MWRADSGSRRSTPWCWLASDHLLVLVVGSCSPRAPALANRGYPSSCVDRLQWWRSSLLRRGAVRVLVAGPHRAVKLCPAPYRPPRAARSSTGFVLHLTIGRGLPFTTPRRPPTSSTCLGPGRLTDCLPTGSSRGGEHLLPSALRRAYGPEVIPEGVGPSQCRPRVPLLRASTSGLMVPVVGRRSPAPVAPRRRRAPDDVLLTHRPIQYLLPTLAPVQPPTLSPV